ncbi:hypothetical protein RRG08_008498 [Elysia crispata]|uniref:Uncharacterized protein n=1 Tax=Elysia crispata TaxID=231223 RepID=A0AAE0Z9R7_9GAST|nr:hypothetical protein RRG08_008498 [Elysia crispata]
MAGVLFEDIFDVKHVDKDGKKFDRAGKTDDVTSAPRLAPRPERSRPVPHPQHPTPCLVLSTRAVDLQTSQ